MRRILDAGIYSTHTPCGAMLKLSREMYVSLETVDSPPIFIIKLEICLYLIAVARLLQGICRSTMLRTFRPLTAIGAHLMGAECWLLAVGTLGRWGVAVKLLGPLPGQQLLQLNSGQVKVNIYLPLS